MGEIVTFYSYKGGTGRTMALANIAWLLACNGYQVLTIDWDLEAPGLHRFFKPFLIDPELFETDGLVDLLWTFTTRRLTPPLSKELDAAESFNDVYEDQIADLLEDATTTIDTTSFKWRFPPRSSDELTRGSIDLIGAGRQVPTYSERVNTFDWKRFYEIGGARLLEQIKGYLKREYDYVLIDSRTGVSDTSGICTIQMPDSVVACFTLNRQSIEGVAAILGSIQSFRGPTINGSEIALYPVATRIENQEQRKLEAARGRAREVFQQFLPREARAKPREYWDIMEIPYRTFYAFEEVLAAFGDTAGDAGAQDTLLSKFEAVARFVLKRQRLVVPEVPEEWRNKVIEAYALGTTREQPADRTPTSGAKGTNLRLIYDKEALWLRSEFNYRTLLTDRELRLLEQQDVPGASTRIGHFYEESMKMQRFSKRLASSSIALWAFILLPWLAWISTEAALTRPWVPTLPPFSFIALWGAGVVAVLLALASISWVSVARPYVMSFLQILLAILRGPVQAYTRDLVTFERSAPRER